MARTKHPVLAAGNLIEGILGIGAIASLGITIFTGGITVPLAFTMIYTIGVAAIALLSAYHLFV